MAVRNGPVVTRNGVLLAIWRFLGYDILIEECVLRWKNRKSVTKVQADSKNLLLYEDLAELWLATDFINIMM